MTVPYESTGRVSQKARTRRALIAATRELLGNGDTPTMEKAAALAEVSRTTAYRYFPDIRALLVATYPHAEQDSLLDDDASDDPVERLQVVAADQTRRILEFEREMRAVLRLSLDAGSAAAASELPVHRGLRIKWIEDALAPLGGRLSERELASIVRGIGATLGIEAFVWLTDIAGLSKDDAASTMRSNASRILRAALLES